MRDRIWIGIVSLSLLSMGLFVGCGNEKEKREVESTAAVPVQVAQVVRGDIRTTISLTGSIQPWKEVNIVPDVPGKVARIYVKEGDRVEQGQVLAELDTRTARLQLEQAEAGLAVAQANFNSASKDWERMQDLHEKGTVSPQQVEKVQLGYEAAKAQLQQAKAGLKLARHQLEVSVMKAPFGGIITGKSMNEGEYINPAMGGMGPGGGSVVTLMDLSKVKIEVQVSERDVGKIHVGQDALITTDAYPGKTFYGNVSNVHPAANPMSRTFKVEIAVPNPDLNLKAGTDAKVKLSIEVHQDVLLVPEKSVVEQAGASFLFVADGDIARRREVKTGLRSEGMVEIIEGVREGETVIGEGNYGLKDGAKVAW
ncbi:MAG: efflux RND transporter periplasmic adaptor subunit [Candidatus Latescibacterota bacterium]|nr:MAG: efflux RND transporter periplasmic adaptor subunit [Candidatus Latescibacterota bacterium]